MLVVEEVVLGCQELLDLEVLVAEEMEVKELVDLMGKQILAAVLEVDKIFLVVPVVPVSSSSLILHKYSKNSK
jgi:hypothetical protein